MIIDDHRIHVAATRSTTRNRSTDHIFGNNILRMKQNIILLLFDVYVRTLMYGTHNVIGTDVRTY